MAITNKLSHGTDYVELEGTSQDDKPEEGIGVNSKFYELDTGDTYYWTGEAWAKVGGDT
jgi:hypothetical protein